jgi:hypothetical protein
MMTEKNILARSFSDRVSEGSDAVLKQFEAFRQATTSVAENSTSPADEMGQGQ